MTSNGSTGAHPNLEDMLQTVRLLYEGTCDNPGVTLSSRCEFHDPLVIVRGKDRVVSMFQKLNRIYPATTVASLSPLQGHTNKYDLAVHYRRQESGKATVFETEIEFIFDGGEILRITEDWKRPINLSGRGRFPVNRWCREGLGRIFS
jgi:hypothetical protein